MSEIDINKCCITHFPEPVLLKKTEAIEKIDESIVKLAARMVEIMVEQKGVGLAGPQAGVNLRIFVVSEDGTAENARVYINPQITPSGPLTSFEEGCLSLPGIYAKIKRYSKCSVTATGLDGQQFTEAGEGLMARAYQHEYDHLEGVLIKDRMGQAARIGARRRLKQLEEDYKKKHSSE